MSTDCIPVGEVRGAEAQGRLDTGDAEMAAAVGGNHGAAAGDGRRSLDGCSAS
jgi:hypothetical protein